MDTKGPENTLEDSHNQAWELLNMGVISVDFLPLDAR